MPCLLFNSPSPMGMGRVEEGRKGMEEGRRGEEEDEEEGGVCVYWNQ